jgi:predicted 3-demethylubiquinone-9 3-methyltransferase (glyoxalase superfamily)
MTKQLVPCIWTDDQADAAAALYLETFPDGRIVATSRYSEVTDNPSGRPRGSVLSVELEIAGQRFTLINGGPMFTPNATISFFVHVDSEAQATPLLTRLADGGKVMMPLASYPWSPWYGWVADRFGVSWQIITARRSPGGATIVPCLMFTGRQHGQAEAALRHYASAFAGGRIDALERYAAGEGAEGTVKHGRATLGSDELIAMDSHFDHGFAFSEGVSLQVMCADQVEVDHFWAALAAGGAPGRCGWLTDRFGVSWQVVPAAISTWMTHPDPAARDRAFAAMMTMSKLDIATLERALAGA